MKVWATETARVNIFEAINYKNVIVTGETGVGKLLAAKNIHLQSSRSEKPFLLIDGSEDIAEEELYRRLFGHALNAFPSATQARMGQLELADHGSVVLKDLHKLNVPLRDRILNFVFERNLCRIGSHTKIFVDVKCIFLLNLEKDYSRGLRDQMVAKEDFDLFEFSVPSLEERREDIGDIINSCLRSYEIEFSIPRIVLDEGVQFIFESYSWLGNIKELKQSLEISILQALKSFDSQNDRYLRVGLDHLDQKLSSEAGLNVLVPVIEEGISFHDAVAEYKKELIHRILDICGYNKTHAAIALQIDIEELDELLRDLSIAA